MKIVINNQEFISFEDFQEAALKDKSLGFEYVDEVETILPDGSKSISRGVFRSVGKTSMTITM